MNEEQYVICVGAAQITTHQQHAKLEGRIWAGGCLLVRSAAAGSQELLDACNCVFVATIACTPHTLQCQCRRQQVAKLCEATHVCDNAYG